MGRRTRVERHLSDQELAAALAEADEPRFVRRLCFISNLYAGDSIEDAAARVRVAQSTGSRWLARWNDDGLADLRPGFGGGRPPKLFPEQREALVAIPEAEQPWSTADVQQLIKDRFDIDYTTGHVSRLLRSFGMRYAKPRTQDPESAECCRRSTP